MIGLSWVMVDFGSHSELRNFQVNRLPHECQSSHSGPRINHLYIPFLLRWKKDGGFNWKDHELMIKLHQVDIQLNI